MIKCPQCGCNFQVTQPAQPTVVVQPQSYGYGCFGSSGFVEGMIVGEILDSSRGETYIDNSTTVIDDSSACDYDDNSDSGSGDW